MTAPSQSSPSQRERVLDLVDRLRDLAARVGVLDPKPELAALVAREEPVEEERADAADVEEAGRARSHADADGHGGSVGRVRERTLTLADLNRATLARQLLPAAPPALPARAIERLVGMQAQWPPAPYVGLWSRLTGFRRATLERAILRGDVLKPTVMRGTLHLVTARDYPTFWAAFRDMPTWFAPEHLEHALRIVPEVRGLARNGPLTQKAALEHLSASTGTPIDTGGAYSMHSVGMRTCCTRPRRRSGPLGPRPLRRLRRAAAGRHACGTD